MQSFFQVLLSFTVFSTLLVNAQSTIDRTTEQGEAAITDADQECTPYSYSPVDDQIGSFPTVWGAASILPDDADALAMWNSISSSIPTNIDTKAVFSSGLDYPSDDPDCWWTYDQCVSPKLTGLPPDIADAPEPSTLGYGFDDGPNCSHNAFYDFLQSQNQKATFYFIGSNVADYPLEAQRALAEDTWSHPYMTTVSSENAFAELWYTPPYGDIDDRIRAIANALGLQTIMWKYDTADASVDGTTITDETVENNYNDFLQTANSGAFTSTGAILLTHELNNFTMSEAVKYYPQLKSAFQYIVPVGVSLNKTQPYLESNYSLPTFDQCERSTVSGHGHNFHSPLIYSTDISGTVTVTGSRISPLNSTSAAPSSVSTSSSSSPSSSASSTSSSPSKESAASANAAQSAMNLSSGKGLLTLLIAAFSFHVSGFQNLL
ncbi:carbohydrate esterase family 4 protein [Lentinula aff. detonsa]|nr:carbohydrate esterase family 4 protein [Lentinula aff. detonsa]